MRQRMLLHIVIVIGLYLLWQAQQDEKFERAAQKTERLVDIENRKDFPALLAALEEIAEGDS